MTRNKRMFSCLCVLAAAGWAQEYRTTLNGTVTDAHRAVIPGARIVVTQVETGSKYSTLSGASGQYTLPLLLPGLYTVAAEAAGFRRYVREGVQISANERITLDISLEIGELTESVTVTADAPMLTTATASVGQPITVRQVDNMPMSGRAPMALAGLSIGVASSQNPQANSRPFDNDGTSQFSMGGGQTRSNELLLDGGPNMSKNRRTGYNPPLDAVQEVKVEVFQSDAAYGDTAGGTVSLVTKGGTNQFRGTMGWYNQVSKLAATPFFTNRVGGKKNVTRYNQWGLTASGPVVVPKIYNGKNRLFWYFAYDGIKHTVPQPITATVPTAAEINGDFSALLPLGSSYQIYDPRTAVAEGTRRRRQPFAGNLIPKDRFSPIAVNYLKYYSAPNQAGRRDGQDNYLADTLRHDDYFTVLSRLDFNLSEKHRFFWNYRSFYRTEYINKLFRNEATGDIRPRDTNGAMFDDVYTFNDTTLLNTRFSWNRFIEMNRRQSDGFDMTRLGFPASLLARSRNRVMPLIDFGDAMRDLGHTGGFKTPYDAFQIFSTLNRVQGAHSLKVGGDARKRRESDANYGDSAGAYEFGTNWVRGPLDNSPGAPLGQSLASFLLGLPTGGRFDLNGARTDVSYYVSVFLQDDWRVTQRLTLNLGLRYEKETGTVERFNRALAGFDFMSPNRVTAAAKAAYAAKPIPELPAGSFNPAGGPIFASAQQRPIYSTESHAFSPRFGFAWKPALLGDKTSLRGGFGVFFQPYGNTGVYQPGFSQRTPLVATLDGYLTPYSTLANPFPTGILDPPGATGGINTYLGQGITYFNPKAGAPYTTRWTLTLQQQLRRNLVLETGYIGSRSLHMPVSRGLNFTPAESLSTSPGRDQAVINRLTANVANPFQGLLPGTGLDGSTVSVEQLLRAHPQLSGLTVDSENEGYADYHALEARVENRLSAGLQFLTSFTLSRMMEATGRLNASDLPLHRRVATEDRPYRLVFSGSYDLPFGKGKPLLGAAGPWWNGLLGGWVVSGIFTLQGGTVLAWGNLIYYGGALNYNPRNIDRSFDTTRFNTIPAQQLDRNIRTFPQTFSNLRQDRIENLEAAVIKRIPVREPLTLQLRFEAFNALNRTQFNAPSLSPTSSAFGTTTSQANWCRVIQTGLRLTW